MKPLRTMHLTNSWHETSGGIATLYRALMKAANRRGHELRLVVPGENDRVENAGEFCKIYYVKAPRARFNAQYRTIYPSQYMWRGSRVQKILTVERPDLVEICDKYTLNYLGALLRRRLLPAIDFRPVVVGLSCERMDDNFRSYIGNVPFSRAFCAAYVKWIYFPFFDHHIVNSAYTAEELRMASQGQMVPRNVWIKPMGVDLGHFAPERKSREARLRLAQYFPESNDPVLLLYAGRLVPEKNLSLLFDVFVRLADDPQRNYRLIVAGDGIERGCWETFCAKHAPGRARFLGHVKDPSDLADLFANCDAFIHPNAHEPFGIAPLEAMASGLPLVAPNSGGVASYANRENAWVVAPDSESFTNALREVLADPAQRARRTQNALQMAAQYRWDAVASSFLDLYAEIHAAATTKSDALPAADFASTQAHGLQLALSRGVSQGAEKMFRIASTFFPRARA